MAELGALKELETLRIGRIYYPRDGFDAARVEREIWKAVRAPGAPEAPVLHEARALLEDARSLSLRADALARDAKELADRTAELLERIRAAEGD